MLFNQVSSKSSLFAVSIASSQSSQVHQISYKKASLQGCCSSSIYISLFLFIAIISTLSFLFSFSNVFLLQSNIFCSH